jgi:hypothetical protein
MSENKILIPAILTGYGPKADKSWRVALNINEPNAEQKVIIDRLFQQSCYVLIKEGEIRKEEQSLIDSLEAKEFKIKTNSQRLKGVLYRVWEQHHTANMTEKEYYDFEMNRIIDHYKSKLS